MDKAFWLNKKVLITGHTGTQGTWLSTWLSLLGAQVLGFSLEPSQIVNVRNANKPYWQVSSQWGNIRDANQVNRVIDRFKPDIIFHIAHLSMDKRGHESPHQAWTTNVQGTINVLEAIRQLDGKLSAVFVALLLAMGSLKTLIPP